MAKVLGKLTHPDGWTAYLTSDNEWKSKDKRIWAKLMLVSPRRPGDLAIDGTTVPGILKMRAAAKKLGAKLSIPGGVPKKVEGAIY